MTKVFLLLGTNMGDRTGNLKDAKMSILQHGLVVSCESAIYETEPWGFAGQMNFYNQVLQVNTKLSAAELLEILLEIEKLLGRERKKSCYEDRIIDIDILLFGDEIIREPELIIPHPLLHVRRFALIPLCELAPNNIHPVMKIKMKEILEACINGQKVWLDGKLIS
jgi:2-amino-4-hydroxy-6-hydroxymethyldihydropteridine diphosphokinase